MAQTSLHRRDRHMQHILPWNGPQVGVDREAGNPGELLARENERPAIALFARHARVDKDVLQLARASAAGRPQSETRSPVSDAQLKPGPKVGGVAVVAAGAASDVEAGRIDGSTLRGDDFHE